MLGQLKFKNPPAYLDSGYWMLDAGSPARPSYRFIRRIQFKIENSKFKIPTYPVGVNSLIRNPQSAIESSWKAAKMGAAQ
jgi:hypothetical protein